MSKGVSNKVFPKSKMAKIAKLDKVFKMSFAIMGVAGQIAPA